MAESTELAKGIKTRPVFRNIHVTQLGGYRLPLAALVSILHRISGAILFLLLPFVIWMFDLSVTSEVSYSQFTSAFVAGAGWFPGWFLKLVCLALIWSYLHHFIAGVRHLYMDMTHATSKQFGRRSAATTMVLSLVLTVLLAAKLFGVY
ncbi:MAG: sdhC [Rhizobacter sp.]|nr:sdhC [Rhizobacter sp.]